MPTNILILTNTESSKGLNDASLFQGLLAISIGMEAFCELLDESIGHQVHHTPTLLSHLLVQVLEIRWPYGGPRHSTCVKIHAIGSEIR